MTCPEAPQYRHNLWVSLLLRSAIDNRVDSIFIGSGELDDSGWSEQAEHMMGDSDGELDKLFKTAGIIVCSELQPQRWCEPLSVGVDHKWKYHQQAY
ncbi:hypothetical protein DPX16_22331 [Anabarilius grahami]|uniref:Uncharacterized protein n=1 Tax=Anabarilius grahami TaxID=495550 RepID=A0A3N0YRI5_ANAGA|nr:hypothetical protein DPX16_22331 [Anabarilius grahami]